MLRLHCGRCDNVVEMDFAAVAATCTPVMCEACCEDDIDYATLHLPEPRLYGQDLDMRRWTP